MFAFLPLSLLASEKSAFTIYIKLASGSSSYVNKNGVFWYHKIFLSKCTNEEMPGGTKILFLLALCLCAEGLKVISNDSGPGSKTQLIETLIILGHH
jgi:hypothetical protein